jgi:uncharacterized protein (TIGR02246 family)
MRRYSSILTILTLAISWGSSFAEITDEDRRGIQNTIETYVKAFNEGNVDALLEHWAENGDYVDVAGLHLKGKEQIRAAYEEFLAAAPEPQIEIAITSLDIVDDNIAIEDGFREVSVSPTLPGRRIRYTAYHVKHKGKWYLQSVRDAAAFTPTNYAYLQGLEWAVGAWESKADNGAVMSSVCTWDEGQNFLIREYSTSLQGQQISGGMQWIGWDPAEGTVRSWSFDSTGGFSEGTWSQDGASWIADSTSTLLSGQRMNEKHVLSLVDPDTLTWLAKDRSLDGAPLPDVEEVTIKRVTP